MKKLDLLKLKKNILMATLTLSTTLSYSYLDKLDVSANNKIESYTENEMSSEEKVNHYSNIFNLKKDIILNYFKDKTRNFTAYEWEHHNYLNGKTFENKHLAIISTIKDIYYNPWKYGFTLEEIKDDATYTEYLKAEELIEKYSDIVGINKNIPLSICYAECGIGATSYNFIERNNPAGLGNLYFDNKEMGIIFFVLLLKENYGCTIDSDESFFNRVASTYCPPNPEHWTGMTNSIYYCINQDYYFYAPEIIELQKERKLLEKNRAAK